MGTETVNQHFWCAMSYRSSQEIEDAIDKRDALRIKLSLLLESEADATAILKAQREVVRLTKAIDQLRIELNPDAPRMVRRRSSLGSSPRTA
jgi:hypothetical protein